MKQIGIDNTEDWDAEKVGSTVHWFDKFHELNFSKQDYLTMLETFKQRLPIDKLRIKSHIKSGMTKKQTTNTGFASGGVMCNFSIKHE
jgi:hypothetical protein